jgi:putative endonuclease
MGMESYQLGIEGEVFAQEYLRSNGYEIIEKNFRCQQGEIDIVARQAEFLVFVEVKNYSFHSLNSPLSAIVKNKQENIIHAARVYLYKNRIKNTNCRFDVLTIYRRPDGSRAVELFRNAFQAQRPY